MGINLLLVAIGLTICFGGIYLRKVCSAFLGLVWGALCSFAVILITVGLWGIDEESFYIVAVCAVVFAIISCIHDKLCAAINSFLSVFFFVAILLLVSDSVEGTALFLIAGVIAFIFSLISIRIYDYSFILTTAFSGAFIASIGLCGIVYDAEVSDVLMELLFGDEATSIVVMGTLILGVLGTIVQWRRLKGRASKNTEVEKDTPKAVSLSKSITDIVDRAAEKYPLVREIKSNLALILVPWIVTIIWGQWGTQLLWKVFPSMYDYGMIRETLWHYMPTVISTILSAWELAAFVVTIKTRSKGFCIAWMIPNMLLALIYLGEVFDFLSNFQGPAWIFDLSSAALCFVPFASWWIIRKLEKVHAIFADKKVRSYVLCGICTFFVQWIVGEAIFFLEMRLIAFGPTYTPPFVSFLLIVLEIAVMAIIVQAMYKHNAVEKQEDVAVVIGDVFVN